MKKQKPSLMMPKMTCLAMLSALAMGAFPQVSNAKEFTSAEFLEWPSNKQDSYFQISVTMATFIASQHEGSSTASCINDWYFKNQEAKNQHMRAVMQEHTQFHPSGIILAALQKACGTM